MTYVIAIPSYNRTDTLKEKTLVVLKKHKIPASKIHIFVANKDEFAKYSDGLAKDTYKDIIIGEKGVVNIRNFIQEYFSLGQEIVLLDDDIVDFFELSSDGKKLKSAKNLNSIFERGFDLCKKQGYHMWGISPVCNAFFMKKEYSADLKFLIGHTYGLINQKLKIPQIMKVKEDYWLSLTNAVKDGGVIRLNDVCAKTKMYAEGGIGPKEERVENNKKAVEFLIAKFGDLVRKNPKREGEILLARSISSQGSRKTRKIKRA